MMAVDFYILALWFAYSLAFAISIAFLYYAYRKSLQQVAAAQTKIMSTTYFIDVKDDRAYAMLDLAEEIVDRNPNRAIELARGALDILLERACSALGVDTSGTMEDKVRRLQEAGVVFPPEFGRAHMLRRPRDVIAFVKGVAKFFREAPVVVRKGEGSSL